MIVLWPEIREVKNPAFRAHAFTENGRTVIEVDENLKGKERSRAILAAWREHERGLAALIALPVLLYVWEPFKRWASKHPAGAVAAGVTYGGALALTVSYLVTAPVSGTGRPVSTPHQVTATAPPGVLVSVTPTGSLTPARTPRATPPATGSRPTPASHPTGSARPEPATTRRPAPQTTTSRPAPPPTPDRSGPAGVKQSAPDVPESTRTRPPASDGTESSDAPAPAPTSEAPASGPSTRDCLVRVEVDPLLDVCALG